MKNDKNIEMIKIVARGLKDLLGDVIFVGGATVPFYIDDQGAPPLRTTEDVDCVIKLASRVAFHKLEEKLRKLKFKNYYEGERTVICRWTYSGIIVDIMPTDTKILGFSNMWYSESIAHPQIVNLDDGQIIKIQKAPYFLATKIEAFSERGKNDFRGSKDIEDIIAVIDGDSALKGEVERAPAPVKKYIIDFLKECLADPFFNDAIRGHLPAITEKGRAEEAIEIIKEIVKKK